MIAQTLGRYKLIVSYDGTAYRGWQSQQQVPTVQDRIATTFQKLFNKNISLVAASRTDAGVHALGQVLVLTTDLVIEAHKLQFALNNALPKDILIRHASAQDRTFHPQLRVKQKTYWYHFCTKRPLPFATRYVWHASYVLDMQKLKNALQLFVGTHDFRSFCLPEQYDNTVRTIDSINLEYLKRFGVFRIEVRGKSFMHHMIRRIVGSALYIASHPELPLTLIHEAFVKKDPTLTLFNAPPHGLLLAKIQYETRKDT